MFIANREGRQEMELKGRKVGGLYRPYIAATEWLQHVTLMGGGGGFVRAHKNKPGALKSAFRALRSTLRSRA